MLFIDGSWLYQVRPFLLNVEGRPDFELDYKALPVLVKNQLQNTMEFQVDMVRTWYFGTVAVNKPGHDNTRERQFYEMLNKRCLYSTEIYEVDFKNKEVARKENCLEVGLSSMALMQAIQPGAFDIACFLMGDIDYLPLFRHLKLLGKRILLVGVKGNTGFNPMHPRLLDESNLFDFSPLFLDDHMEHLRYHRSEQLRTCNSCGKEEATSFTSEWFYCKNCREEYNLLRTKQPQEL